MDSSQLDKILQNDNQTANVEQKVLELFELFEKCSQGDDLKLDTSLTQFDHDLTLELSDTHSFLRLSYTLEKQGDDLPQGILGIVTLEYTGQDLQPLKARPLTERSFQGFLNLLYLTDEKWFVLNPLVYPEEATRKELLLTPTVIQERILKPLFAH